MNIPVEIVTALFTAVLALQGWVLVEVIRLKISVAILKRRVFHHGTKDEEEEKD